MVATQVPEAARIQALHRYSILDTPAEVDFDDLTALASQICCAPVALLAFFDVDRYWFKSRVGVALAESPRDLPLRAACPDARFVAEAPLVTPDGHTIGALCVMDRAERVLDSTQREALVRLARQAMAQLELRLAQQRTALRPTAPHHMAREILEDLQSALDEHASVVVLSAAGSVTHANDRFCESSSYESTELMGQHFASTHLVDHATEAGQRMWQTLAAGRVWIGDLHHRAKNGALYWEQSTIVPFLGSDRRPHHYIVIGADITDRKWAEQFLLANEHSLAITLHSIGDAVLAVDAERRVTRINAIAEILLGCAASDAIGRPVDKVLQVINEETGAPLAPVEDVLSTGQVHGTSQLAAVVSSDGMERPVAYRAAPICDTGGRVTGVVLVFRDESAERAAALTQRDTEARLREANAQLERRISESTRELRDNEQFVRASLDALTSHIAVLDHEGRILATNRAWRQFAGQNGLVPAQVDVGTNYLQICDRDPEGAEAARIIREVMSGRSSTESLEYPCHSPHEERWFSCQVTRFSGEGPARVVIAHENITQRKHAEEALRQSQKMQIVGQFAGGIAHDFNNLLAVILSFSSFVNDDLAEGDPRREDLAEVLRASEKAISLIRQISTFSRRHHPAKRPVDLNSSVATVLKMLRRTVGEHIEVVVQPSARPPVVRLDPVQFDQILLNLAGNARDAMAGGGRLTLTIAHTGPCRDGKCSECVRLTVTDTGEGMEPATLDRIFEPFFTTKEVGQGTGLGLSTCYAIVNEAGGTIRAESSVGHGTSVILDLPACNEPVVDLTDPDTQDPEGHGERVLVVEDDDALRKAAVRILETAGYHVLEASNGEEAIEKMDDPRIELDLIITDVVMPRRGGFAVLAHARRRCPDIRVLLTSGYLDGSGGSEVIAGDSPLLWKPYTRSNLLHAAHDALGEAASQRGSSPANAVSRAPEPVLLIEDEEAIAAATRRILSRAGYKVTVASTVALARRLLEQDGPYAAVICDLTLPDGSGAELVSWLQHAYPEQARRVIMITGGAVDEPGRLLAASGSVEFLQKPFDPRRLLDSVRAIASTWHAVKPDPIP